MRSLRDDRDQHEHVNGVHRTPARPVRPTSDREVPIVPEGELDARPDWWVRFTAAIAARKRVGAPAGLPQRIMESIGRLPAR